MAVVQVSGNKYDLVTDSRFKKWGKLIRNGEYDLQAKNGYSLTGAFVRWGESVPLNKGEYLVLAAESGSRKYAAYDYRLVGVDENGEAQEITDTDIDTALANTPLPDDVIAKTANSRLYRYAAYIHVMTRNAMDDPLADARAALLALTDNQRRQLFAEFPN